MWPFLSLLLVVDIERVDYFHYAFDQLLEECDTFHPQLDLYEFHLDVGIVFCDGDFAIKHFKNLDIPISDGYLKRVELVQTPIVHYILDRKVEFVRLVLVLNIDDALVYYYCCYRGGGWWGLLDLQWDLLY